MPKLYISYTPEDLKEHAIAACNAARSDGWEIVDGSERVNPAARLADVQSCDSLLALSACFYSDHVEKDWEVARQKAIPTASLIIRPDAAWPLPRIQFDPEKIEARGTLHQKLRQSDWVGEFDQDPGSIEHSIKDLLVTLRSAVGRKNLVKVFVVWDFTVPGLDLILAGLQKRPPAGYQLYVPGVGDRSAAGEILRDIVLRGIREADRVLVITDRPNANVSFEAGLALGFGKPVALMYFGAQLPGWLEESAFKGFIVNPIQTVDELRNMVVDENSWIRRSRPPGVPSSGRTLFLTPIGYVGSALREEQRDRHPSWLTQSKTEFNLNDLDRTFSTVAQTIWCIASYSEGSDSRDGSENAANGLIFGWFYARSHESFGENQQTRCWVLRQANARKVVDVEVFEKTFNSIDQFASHLAEVSKHDLRLPSPARLDTARFSRASYKMVRIPSLSPHHALWVGVYAVTNRDFKVFCDESGHPFPAGWKPDDHPVVNVSLDDAEAFARWADLEIPTGQMWLHAALAGSQSRYWWGDDDELVSEVAWYSENSGGQPHSVGGKKPNTWDLYDMLGNTWEWTRHYQTLAAGRYSDGDVQIVKARIYGGSFRDSLKELREARECDVTMRNGWTGFRCIRLKD